MFSASGFFYFALIGLAADRIIKYFIITMPSAFTGFFVFDNNLGLVRHLNQGFAWSLNISNAGSAFLMAGSAILIIWYYFYQQRIECIWLIIAGALSNFFDRLIHGGVVDYLVVPWGGIINLADILIFFGVILLILGSAHSSSRFKR